MASFIRRLIYTLSNKITREGQKNSPEGKLTADFTKSEKSLFSIKSESSYNAYLSNGGLTLGLKKPNCIAWVEIPELEYQDHVIEAKISLDSRGGYASAGLIFRMMDEGSYYMALVSSRGYFRLDLVKENAPKTLIAWTEIYEHKPRTPARRSGEESAPVFDETNISIKIIAYGPYFIFIVNDKWVGETSDDSIAFGVPALVLASYETSDKKSPNAQEAADEYICSVRLDSFSVDSRISVIDDNFKKWSDESNINAERRLRLAETFAVMGEASKSLDQITKAWKRRDEAISAVSTTYTEVRTRKELLLAARMSFRLGQYSDAEEYIDGIIYQLAGDPQKLAASAEGKEALKEKLKILNELNKFKELKKFVLKYKKFITKDIDFYTKLARCHWELKDYKVSADMWDRAFKLDSENGVYAANAGNALELIDRKDEALAHFLSAGNIFLRQDNLPELAVLIPKLSILGENNWEARTLAGKWAFSIEDYDRCLSDFTAANKLRNATRPRPQEDPALYYLWGIVLNMKGRNSDAIRLLEKAVKLAPDYGLFRFKLVEIKLTSGKNEQDTKQLVEELKLALKNIDDSEGQMANHAGNLLLETGNEKDAKYFFEKAKKK